MREFSGQTAVITGGASDMGLGMARSFAKRGMQLVLADLDEKLLLSRRAGVRASGGCC